MGPNLRKFRKTVKLAFFEEERSFDMGGVFRQRAAHPRKEKNRVPPVNSIVSSKWRL